MPGSTPARSRAGAPRAASPRTMSRRSFLRNPRSRPPSSSIWIENASSLRRSPRMSSPLAVTSTTRCGRSGVARAVSPAAGGGAASVLRYATIARISSSVAALGGITVPAMPPRIVCVTRSSVAPAAQSAVRFGPLSPFASAPWHAAHVSAKSAAPRRTSCARGADASRPAAASVSVPAASVLGIISVPAECERGEYTAPRESRITTNSYFQIPNS